VRLFAIVIWEKIFAELGAEKMEAGYGSINMKEKRHKEWGFRNSAHGAEKTFYFYDN
jgi:hypothetical protein